MISILQFPFITPYFYTTQFLGSCTSPLQQWFLFGKIAENPIVTPSTSVQVITPSGVNKYLQSVTVEATAAA